MMPIFFVNEDVSKQDCTNAINSWNLVLNDNSPGFNAKRGQPGYEQASCIMFFYDSFYSRLFDVHPMARPMFKSGMKSQGKFLVKMISLSISLLDDNEKFTQTLTKLTEVHNDRGVKAVEYGIVGEVLLWTLRRCLGTAYTAEVHTAWIRILCRMLRVMVPMAVAFEMQSGRAQEARMLEIQYAQTHGGIAPAPCTTVVTPQTLGTNIRLTANIGV
jgi:hemoglobin-like flavoprotein